MAMFPTTIAGFCADALDNMPGLITIDDDDDGQNAMANQEPAAVKTVTSGPETTPDNIPIPTAIAGSAEALNNVPGVHKRITIDDYDDSRSTAADQEPLTVKTVTAGQETTLDSMPIPTVIAGISTEALDTMPGLREHITNKDDGDSRTTIACQEPPTVMMVTTRPETIPITTAIAGLSAEALDNVSGLCERIAIDGDDDGQTTIACPQPPVTTGPETTLDTIPTVTNAIAGFSPESFDNVPGLRHHIAIDDNNDGQSTITSQEPLTVKAVTAGLETLDDMPGIRKRIAIYDHDYTSTASQEPHTLLAFITGELCLRVGDNLAGLLNITLVGAHLFSAQSRKRIVALTKCELEVLQASFLGLGMCFFFGGLNYFEQGFSASTSQLSLSLLTISVIAILLPAAYNLTATDPNDGSHILALSRVYIGYLAFQLYSHQILYDNDNYAKSTVYHSIFRPEFVTKFKSRMHKIVGKSDLERANWDLEEEEEELIGITAEWLVSSIDGITAAGNISKEFVSIILLPIIGNVTEHFSAQITLFIFPLNVTLSWILGKPLTLLFDTYQSVIMFLAV
ncbi:hypothetical protein H0H92_011680 [Tricholoma furcatifolium]|nr:hypothetical protein H0H92_011680 [Tricholoma furcatifolium]